ncbi:sialic acid synthase [Condylostylus longicornis]|uniref:sialic acid synthase n=1 Tax=Condylostylus longicornis TaxID=2530218 RepID=UPI00244DD598|nr:sialic acid synthase [Condylostylus longicornis]
MMEKNDCALKIENISVGSENNPIFIIAEIGQNHQGSIEVAKKLILSAKECGCNCVKFQKSHLTTKFTGKALLRPYNGENSWGKTYGEHKMFLEFSLEQYGELRNFANQLGLIFSASAMDEISLSQLVDLQLSFIKIGSGDANNFKLLQDAAKTHIPLIISTGMQNMITIEKIVEIMNDNCKKNFALLHCVSSYPTNLEDSTLKMIKLFKKKFPNVVIGYSGHEKGILLSQIAVLLGAKIVERHFTLNKNQKGSDHSVSLDPTEMRLLVERIRNFEKQGYTKIMRTDEQIIKILKCENENSVRQSLKDVSSKEILPCELPCRKKLGKSLVYRKPLKENYIIKTEDIIAKVSEPFGISAEFIYEVIGRKLKVNVAEDEIIEFIHLY